MTTPSLRDMPDVDRLRVTRYVELLLEIDRDLELRDGIPQTEHGNNNASDNTGARIY